MSPIGGAGGFLPASEQALLLRAALLGGEEALGAWREWRARADIGHLDPGSFRLLPLLYHNLKLHGADDPLMGKLRGIYRMAWYRNQVLLGKLALLLGSFHAAGIRTMVLKGAALTLLHYKDPGLRPMADLDILVPVEQAGDAAGVLTQLRWMPQGKHPRRISGSYCSCVSSLPFENGPREECDLHWHVLAECCYAGADDAFWAGAVPITVHNVPTLALNPAHQLLHLCVHGARWNVVPPLRWIADATTVMKNSGSGTDWRQLAAEARMRRLVLPLREALACVREWVDAPVPAEVLADLRAIPVGRAERMEYRIRTRPPGLLGHLPEACLRHLAYSSGPGGNGFPARAARLPVALQHFWGVDHLWQTPFSAACKAARRLTRAALRRACRMIAPTA